MVFFSIFLSLLAAVFALSALTLQHKTVRRVLFFVNLVTAVGGILLLVLSYSQAMATLAGDASPDLLSWAQDAYFLWLRLGAGFAAGVGIPLFLAALIRHKMRRIRAVSGVAGTLLVLIFGGLYAIMCVGEEIDPAPWIRLSTLGLASLTTAWSAVDLAFDAKTASIPKKNR